MSSRNVFKAALAVALFAVLGAFSPAANANSALDQYVEEVPNTTGNHDPETNTNPTKDQKQPAKVDRERTRQLEAQGEEGQNLLAVANGSGTGGNGPTAPGAEQSSKDGGAIGTTAGDRGRVDTNGPGAAKSLKAAADASGINAPLFIFVVLLAVAMGATAWMRRTRGARHS
jgi:hypothetical protein